MKDDCIGYTKYYDIHMNDNADANANADANTDANTNADANATMEGNNQWYMLCLSLLTPIIIMGIVYFILNE